MYTLSQYRGDLAEQTQAEIESLAEDCAQDAMLAILAHLHEFRGDSKFTTWAYKFAVNIALVTARCERWKSVSLDQLLNDAESPGWPVQIEQAHDPDRPALQKEIWATLREAMDRDLTERQRPVVKALVFDEVPVDEVVRHLDSNRNAIYKLLGRRGESGVTKRLIKATGMNILPGSFASFAQVPPPIHGLRSLS